MKAKVIMAVFVLTAAALLIFSQIGREAFAQAADFPRGALVYVQVSDLPALIRLWEESGFKEKYLESANYGDFKNRHLAIKLASRWGEFNEAAGFELDLATLAGLAEKRAALALYDVGKLEFVFIAPMSEEVFAATKFLQNRGQFEELALDGGATVYRAAVSADHGRQNQHLIFTAAKGRFVLATSERLLTQTLANINGGGGSNSLAGAPQFKTLGENAEPRLATVWVDQAALNEDYYFKRYWLGAGAAALKNVRAGMFDFSAEEGRLVERRVFLLDQPVNPAALEKARGERSLAYLPGNIPLYRLRPAAAGAADSAVRQTFFERDDPGAKKPARRYHYGFDDFEDYREQDYSYLDETFDQTIDEADETEAGPPAAPRPETNFSRLLAGAGPQTVLTFTRPKLSPAPLFAEFERAAVLSLGSPDNFDRASFESAVEGVFASQFMTSAPGVKFEWATADAGGATARELSLPALGTSAVYAVRGDELILTNSADFLREIVGLQNPPRDAPPGSPFTELTVIDLGQRGEAYDRVFARLAALKSANPFFSENVRSLLDSLSGVKTIRVKRGHAGKFLREEVSFNFQ